MAPMNPRVEFCLFSSETRRFGSPIFIAISLAVLIDMAGQNLPAQTSGLPSNPQGITVQYGTSTPGIRHELPSNQELGVDINHFIGDPAKSRPYLSHEAIMTRTILTHGDPLSFGQPGAILEYRKELAVGELQPGDQTPLVELADQMFVYIESGEGRLDDGRGYWDLREAIAALIPPHVKHRFINHSDKPLTMLMMLTSEDPKEVTLRKDILVRDGRVLPYLSKNSHWSYLSKILFTAADGLAPAETISIAFMAPMTIAAPHAHPPHREELWIKLPPAEGSFLFLGSEVQPMPANVAFLAPPTGITTHSIMNLSHRIQAWIGTGREKGGAPFLGSVVQPLVRPHSLDARQ
jgi:mannose-6-phosphate isomerase-like protein (cupin superfamily)